MTIKFHHAVLFGVGIGAFGLGLGLPLWNEGWNLDVSDLTFIPPVMWINIWLIKKLFKR